MEKEIFVPVEKDAAENVEDGAFLVTLAHELHFEGKDYTKIDLHGLENLTARDMIEVNKRLNRAGNVDFIQEMTLEYALNIAQIATGLPLEFFLELPPYAAMAVKNRVTGFLYRQE